MNFNFFTGGKWNLDKVAPPWKDRPSIYQHILANIRAGEPGLGETGEVLPDEEIVRGDKQLRWVPGAFDGTFGHHTSHTEGAEAAKQIIEAFRSLARKANDERAASLYATLLDHSALTIVDHLLGAVLSVNELEAERIHMIARWLATNAADREPVKYAIALLGVFQGGHDRDLLLTLGRHEEFTLFASVALQNSDEDAELSLWSLARLVTGWGRIHIVERLAETNDDQIKSWMLRDGYHNDVMHEYTALICAQTGGLLGALRQRDADEKLLKGAGFILSALVEGRRGPAAGIDSYPDGAEATQLYLQHLQPRELDLEDYIAVSTIESFLNEEDGEVKDPDLGWPERRAKLLQLTGAIRSQPDWEQKIRAAIDSENRDTFWRATWAAQLRGLDVWDVYFERLKRGEDQWLFAMQTKDRERIDRVITLAEETLPLDEIASGPSDSLGLGPEFQHHSALDYVLQELPRFPGRGWPLIRAGLQSPTVRNRNKAVEALASWDRNTWPAEAEPLLKRTLELEPVSDTSALMIKALEGQ